ncbi:MAG: CBS domain-containing protein [Candidatus Krumholzibacteriia bacterium]
MKTVNQILDTKGREIWCVAPESSVFDAIQMMADKHVGALLVTQNDKLVGIVSERDYARKVILQGKSSKKTAVQEIMTKRVAYAQPGQTVEDCMALMTQKHIRHLPVLDGDRLVGMVSIGDLVKTIIAEQQFMIEQLENYITG